MYGLLSLCLEYGSALWNGDGTSVHVGCLRVNSVVVL